MIPSHPVFYLKANNFLLEALALLKYPSRFKKVLNKMQLVIDSPSFPKNDNIMALSFLYSYTNRLNLYFWKDGLERLGDYSRNHRSN